MGLFNRYGAEEAYEERQASAIQSKRGISDELYVHQMVKLPEPEKMWSTGQKYEIRQEVEDSRHALAYAREKIAMSENAVLGRISTQWKEDYEKQSKEFIDKEREYLKDLQTKDNKIAELEAKISRLERENERLNQEIDEWETASRDHRGTTYVTQPRDPKTGRFESMGYTETQTETNANTKPLTEEDFRKKSFLVWCDIKREVAKNIREKNSPEYNVVPIMKRHDLNSETVRKYNRIWNSRYAAGMIPVSKLVEVGLYRQFYGQAVSTFDNKKISTPTE